MAPTPGSHWRHYKGHLYEVLQVVQHSEEKVQVGIHSRPLLMVVYQEVDQHGGVAPGTIPWCRPLSMWNEQIDPHSYHSSELDQGVEKGTVPRFEQVQLTSRQPMRCG